jgi:hypothetical protein
VREKMLTPLEISAIKELFFATVLVFLTFVSAVAFLLSASRQKQQAISAHAHAQLKRLPQLIVVRVVIIRPLQLQMHTDGHMGSAHQHTFHRGCEV